LPDASARPLGRDQVRAAEERDLADLIAMRLALFEDQIGKGLLDIPPLDPESLARSTAGLLGRPRTFVLVAMIGGRPAGYAYARIRIVPEVINPRVAIIEEWYVDPERASVGAALALLRRMLQVLEETGVDRIQGRALFKNKASRSFIELCGFTPNLAVYEYSPGSS
jgi:GNAT superfamily N-acetyltransferase